MRGALRINRPRAFSNCRCRGGASTAATRSIRSTTPPATLRARATQRGWSAFAADGRQAGEGRRRRRTRFAPAPQADPITDPRPRPWLRYHRTGDSGSQSRSNVRRSMRSPIIFGASQLKISALYHGACVIPSAFGVRHVAKTDPRRRHRGRLGASGRLGRKLVVEAGVKVALVEAGRAHRPTTFASIAGPIAPVRNLPRDCCAQDAAAPD